MGTGRIARLGSPRRVLCRAVPPPHPGSPPVVGARFRGVRIAGDRRFSRPGLGSAGAGGRHGHWREPPVRRIPGITLKRLGRKSPALADAFRACVRDAAAGCLCCARSRAGVSCCTLGGCWGHFKASLGAVGCISLLLIELL